jgi:hypothetical protein
MTAHGSLDPKNKKCKSVTEYTVTVSAKGLNVEQIVIAKGGELTAIEFS